MLLHLDLLHDGKLSERREQTARDRFMLFYDLLKLFKRQLYNMHIADSSGTCVKKSILQKGCRFAKYISGLMKIGCNFMSTDGRAEFLDVTAAYDIKILNRIIFLENQFLVRMQEWPI